MKRIAAKGSGPPKTGIQVANTTAKRWSEVQHVRNSLCRGPDTPTRCRRRSVETQLGCVLPGSTEIPPARRRRSQATSLPQGESETFCPDSDTH